jgi:hypothetical protein
LPPSVGAERPAQPRGSVASILLFLFAKCLTLRPVGCNEFGALGLATQIRQYSLMIRQIRQDHIIWDSWPDRDEGII